MRRVAACLLGALLFLSSAPAAAQTKAQRAEAKRLFRTGARNYRAGKFGVAVMAFEQAYDVAPHPALRYSAAQALRRQYALDRDVSHLRKALGYYKAYVAEVKTGGKVAKAAEAIEAIEAQLARLEPKAPPPGDAPPDAPPPKPSPRPKPVKRTGTLAVYAAIDGAAVSIDGKPAQPLDGAAGLTVELPPGRHTVRITRAGYAPVERTRELKVGQLVSIDADLQPLPARLTVVADEGADLLIDGRPMGSAPLATALELPAGRHQLVAGSSGYRVFAEHFELKRGEPHTMDVDLTMTSQRIGAWSLFATAGASVIVGAVFTGFGLREQVDANQLNRLRNQRPLESDEFEAYEGALNRRDNLARLATGAYALAALQGGLGFLLYNFDEPKLHTAVELDKDELKPRVPEEKRDKDDLELGAGVAPVVGGVGVRLVGRF